MQYFSVKAFHWGRDAINGVPTETRHYLKSIVPCVCRASVGYVWMWVVYGYGNVWTTDARHTQGMPLRIERDMEMVERTAVSAGAFILRAMDGELKVALAQHNRSDKTWAMPKGHVEPGETIEQAALREIYEEAGLFNVQLIKYLGNFSRTRTKSNGDVELKTIHYYLAYALEDGEQKGPTDASFVGVSWFSPQQAIGLLYHEEERTFFREQLAPLFASAHP